MTDQEVLALGIEWMEAGFPSFVIELRELPTKIEKLPTTPNGHLDATTDEASFSLMLETARTRRPGAELGVGVVPGPGGAVVLDFDTKNGARGGEVLADLRDRFGSVLDAVTYTSISGAVNVILRKHDLTVLIGNTAPRSWTDVDVRADKGWIVAPGTVTPWGSWSWRTGTLAGIGGAIMPAGLAVELVVASHEQIGVADDLAVKAWFEEGAAVTDELYARALVQWCRTIDRAGNRNPALFEALSWLRRVPPTDINRKEAFLDLANAWEARMAKDGESSRYNEPWDVLQRVVGYADGLRDDQTTLADETIDERFERMVDEEKTRIKVREVARERIQAERLAGLSKLGPLVGVDAIEGWIDDIGDRCYWGTGDTVLMARGESLMIVGREGTGKSTLAIQVARATLGGLDPVGDPWKVLGHAVDPLADDEFVVYLTLDRPQQLARMIVPIFDSQPAAVRSRLLIIRASAMEAVHAGRMHFLTWLGQQLGGRKPGLIIVDSLKDVLIKPTSDEEAGMWHAIRTTITSELDVPMIELHHKKKRTEDSQGNDSAFGSALLTAGVGSVLMIDGQPGDDTFLLSHTKQPAIPQQAIRVLHHRDLAVGAWWTEVIGTPVNDLETMVLDAGEDGITTSELVDKVMAGLGEERKKSTVARDVQRQLGRLKSHGRVIEQAATATTTKRGRPSSVWIWHTFAEGISRQAVVNQKEASTRGNDPSEEFTTSPTAAYLADSCDTSPINPPEKPSDDCDSPPDPLGMTLDEAEQALGEAGLAALWDQGYVIDDDGRIGRAGA